MGRITHIKARFDQDSIDVIMPYVDNRLLTAYDVYKPKPNIILVGILYPYQDRVRISEEELREHLRKYGVEIDEELKPKTFPDDVDVIIGEDRKGFTVLIKRVGGEK